MTAIYEPVITYVDLAGRASVEAQVYEPAQSYVEWKYWSQAGVRNDMPNPQLGSYPFPVPGGVQSSYINKCVDGVTGEWTFWETNFIDSNGVSYPGASFSSSTYRIMAIKYEREIV